MQRGTFRIVAFDGGGVRGPPDNLRLVCVLESGGKAAIWGRQGASGNIDKVIQAGVPCTVECDYREPGDIQARKYGHTHWVRQDLELKIVE